MHAGAGVCAGDAVPGGFYMGADYVKHTHPMATSLSLLAWSLVEFKAGYQVLPATTRLVAGTG